MNWFSLNTTSALITPNLLIYPQRILSNIDRMIDIAGGVNRLRPHIKTHKMGEIINLQQQKNITKFKCSTIAEAKLLAVNKAEDILLAMPLVGYNIDRFIDLKNTYQHSNFSALVDHKDTLDIIIKKSLQTGVTVDLFLDLNVGMNRTGACPSDSDTFDLYKKMIDSNAINARGLHVYDGHINHSDYSERNMACNDAYLEVEQFTALLTKNNLTVPTIIAGGTPTFPVHRQRPSVELSPGTTLLWDAGYQNKYPDLPFLPAAVLISRVISHPTKDTICLDLGHKSVASEMPLPRVQFLNLDNSEQISQSEEHLVVKVSSHQLPKINTIIYALPVHICPTVSKYPKALVVENHQIISSWAVAARDHQINI